MKKTYCLDLSFTYNLLDSPLWYHELKSLDSKDTGFNFHKIVVTLGMLFITFLCFFILEMEMIKTYVVVTRRIDQRQLFKMIVVI